MRPFLVRCSCAALLAFALSARADAPATRPLLTQLNDETQALYRDVQGSIAHVQLPPPQWINNLAGADNPVDKWGPQLDVAVRTKLEQDRASAKGGHYTTVGTVITPATKPSQPAEPGGAQSPPSGPWKITAPPGSNTLILESTGGGSPSVVRINAGGPVGGGGPMQVQLQPANDFTPNNIALVLDDKGHLLVPIYVEREAIGEAGVKVAVGDEPLTTATFVASDRQTNTTILLLPKPAGHPARMGVGRNGGQPAEGSLVLLLSPNSNSARLLVWVANQQEVAGVVVKVDGTVAGFARYGQFFPASGAATVADQLIRYGRARRAILGVAIREVGRSDPLRRDVPELGSRPALCVEEVSPNSAAAKAGLKAGDLILSLGDEPVGDPPAFAAAISAGSGKTPLHLVRDGKKLEISVELKPE